MALRERFFHQAGRLGLELLVVFLGVYLAFLLSEYKETRAAQQQQVLLHGALKQEIDTFLVGADFLSPLMDSLYTVWQQRHNAGEQPVPLVFNIGGVDLPPRGMWDATVASDGLSTLGIETMYLMSEYYNALTILLERYDRLNRFALEEIIPYEADGPSPFYVPATGAIRSKYGAYMQRMQDTLRLLHTVRRMAEDARRHLEAELTKLGSPPGSTHALPPLRGR